MAHEFEVTFGLVEGTKRPAVKWTSPDNVYPRSPWWAGRYGLPTGPRNGLWVLDLDRKGGKDGVAAIQAAGTLPDTYAVLTPSGGVHLYFTYPNDRKIGNPVGILPGVDVRGDGGYVCAGGDYKPLNEHPIVAAPAWLLDLVTSRADAQAVGESAVAISPEHPEWSSRVGTAIAFIAGEPPCVAGEGGQVQIWKMALRIMRTYEMPVDMAMELLSAYNLHCVPPWTDAELRRTLIRAAEEGQGPTGTFGSSFMGGLQPGKVPAPVEGAEWRQVHNPEHEYTVDLTVQCAGALQKTSSLDPKALMSTFAGPGALGGVWTGVWQYDSFRRRVVAVNPPFKLDADIARGGPGISKRDLASLCVWISCNGGKATKEQIGDAIDAAARQAEHHPVRDYLGALPTVAKSAAERYFEGIAGRLWGAEGWRDTLESGHLMRLAIAAVRRIRIPGTKVDTMLVLAGEQGFRKSLLCAHLFGDFFLDQLPPISSGRGHEASIAIEGRWGVEIAEMNALAHAHESAKKEFLTRCADKYRPVFGIAMQECPRQCVFIGTTNDDDFLTDPTGDTRYDVCSISQPIRLDLLNRDEFWACAVALESAGVSHYRDRAELARVKSAELPADGVLFANGAVVPPIMAEGAAFASEDTWTDNVLKAARAAVPDGNGDAYVTAKMCLDAMMIPLERQEGRTAARVKGVLRRAFGVAAPRWLDGRVQRCYLVR